MTLHEIERDLPNGFHDAEVSQITVDFASRSAVLELELWVGSMDSPSDGGRETYRPARLELRGLAYLTMDPPDPNYPYADPGAICVDLCKLDDALQAPTARPGDFVSRFFVMDWNAFITASAREAELTWTADPYDRGEAEPARS